MCLLRERGESEAAEKVRTADLNTALEALRGAENLSETALEKRLADVFATEQNRIADAAILAELLAPLLRKSLDGFNAAKISAPAVAPPSTPVSISTPPSVLATINGAAVARSRRMAK